eukprot:m.44163 g.44163  ORF g.44163 m.44163 type:complete len:106 (-) comp15080_c0_seq4:842-1159(-)
MRALQDIQGNIAKSYFVGATPESNYDIDTTGTLRQVDLCVNRIDYRALEGFPRTRVLSMRCEDGAWKARQYNALAQQVGKHATPLLEMTYANNGNYRLPQQNVPL